MAVLRSALSSVAAIAALAGMALPVAATAQARRYSANSDTAHGPQKLVDKAASVVQEMVRNDPGIRPLLREAVGLYIIPEYGRAGFIIGGKGGAGVVVVRNRNGWSAPAFYNTGGLSIGLQAGAAGGSIVYLLMDRKAIDTFTRGNKFSLNAGAGLSIVTYSTAGKVSTHKGDAILWTNIRGAYAGATVGAQDIDRDNGRTREYYGRDVSAGAVFSGAVTAPGARALTSVLPR